VYLQKDRNCRVINDKNWIAVDTHRGSPHYGRIYAMWDRVFVPKGCNSVKCVLAPIQLRYSDDQGRRWSRRIVVSAARSQGIGVIPLVHRNGDLTAVWINGFTNTVVSQTSTDGGRSWGAPVPISSDLASEPRDMRTGGGLEAAVIDPVTDAMYVAWQDTRLRQDGKNDILLWKSVDEGQSWRSVGRINPPSRLDHLTPGLAAYDNQVSATYLTRSDTSNLVTERFIASQDGGHTFTGERVLNASDLRHAATVFFNGTKFLADYVAIAAWHNVAHPVWCRASTNPDHPREHYHQTTWSATVRLP
jgi:hypothetical protein